MYELLQNHSGGPLEKDVSSTTMATPDYLLYGGPDQDTSHVAFTVQNCAQCMSKQIIFVTK